jgi:predicted RNA-binding protein with EMAP domain
LKHANVARLHNLHAIHNVGVRAGQRLQLDRITNANTSKSAKKSVPVAGNAYVALLPWSRRSGNTSDGMVERKIIGSIQQRDFQIDLRNA